MSKRYLISGLPSTGKSTVTTELLRRGYYAIDADAAIASKTSEGWIWNEDRLQHALLNSNDRDVFICGSATNRDEFINLFDSVFILYIDNVTMRHRLTSRTNNNFGKDPNILAKQLRNNLGVKEYSLKRGRLVIDATQPITTVVDMILEKL
ncbi:hypothetical protein A2707_01165 [Candidatus Saccharibacteria bacterium RIFCSPHIGHO2_01_FULL_45_15]|nr:MAG: hypothetical protein A2707_01165 [Candidatus Saccharibacteria bacterium RIFCSPHIGHO2_01_FULL_45_15]OGL26980.1 MAG: hypothetical protein A3C39_02280 [Candidatus Saccharibacteria bacterium RIFCSPHIGHO2_02_FULL_46_12]OGL32917.1 MAG: hypothetical protein A3E76_06160 [Candidatus Saccharibacteria bacterium RIFCSPHIGHO2_12_FULL_44_22]